MDFEKLILTLISILAGWLLAQFTGVIKDIRYKKKIQKCLIEELEELQTELNRMLISDSRKLQIYSLNCIDKFCSTPLSNHIFKNYYKDVVLILNKNQRISLQLIHTLIENINIRIKEQNKITEDLQKKQLLEGEGCISNAECKLWGEAVITEFHNVSMAIWHIKFHLDNPKSPDLSPYTKEHEQYLQYLENVDKQVQKIMEEAKNLKKKDFEKIYNPESFAK
ncbi:MAG: hypothetical protein ACXV8Q_14920 [Methylobacter sp.]